MRNSAKVECCYLSLERQTRPTKGAKCDLMYYIVASGHWYTGLDLVVRVRDKCMPRDERRWLDDGCMLKRRTATASTPLILRGLFTLVVAWPGGAESEWQAPDL